MVYSPGVLKKALKKHKPKLVWVRKRRESPVGMVKKNDVLYFKKPGGGVFGKARVKKVKDYLKGGKYYVELVISRPMIFGFSFPILKRDRRSWVPCSSGDDVNQQMLLSLPSPTLEQIKKAVEKHYRSLPSKNQMEEALQFFSERGNGSIDNVGAIFLLSIIYAIKHNIDLQGQLRVLLAKNPSKVFPLSIFRGDKK